MFPVEADVVVVAEEEEVPSACRYADVTWLMIPVPVAVIGLLVEPAGIAEDAKDDVTDAMDTGNLVCLGSPSPADWKTVCFILYVVLDASTCCR